MLSFDQYHFTFHNLTDQRYVCNYFSEDGAKKGFQSLYSFMLRNNISGISSHQCFKSGNFVISHFPEKKLNKYTLDFLADAKNHGRA